MEVGCYDLHLYCDLEHGGVYWDKVGQPSEFGAPTEAKAKKKAREAGWVFKRDGRHFCPWCVKNNRS